MTTPTIQAGSKTAKAGDTIIFKDGMDRSYIAEIAPLEEGQEEFDLKALTVLNLRRILSHEGAKTLAGLARVGTPVPASCKFTKTSSCVICRNVYDVLKVTAKAKGSLSKVP